MSSDALRQRWLMAEWKQTQAERQYQDKKTSLRELLSATVLAQDAWADYRRALEVTP